MKLNYVSNIDTIYILIDIENYELSAKNILDYLEKEKEEAKLTAISNTSYKHIITINNLTFQLLTNGTKGYAYILHNNGYEVKISQYKSKIKSLLPIQVRISSEYLWAFGIEKSWAIIYNWIVETFGNIEVEKVCRLDLCTHVSDVDLITDWENSYKGTFKKRNIFLTNNPINAITFGSRESKNMYCRIYNKTLEIREKKHKTWFYEIWNKNGLNSENVWNIEFEIKSEFLRNYNLYTVNDILSHLKDIWEFCTTKFLIKINNDNAKTERCSINSEWLEIQKCYDNFKSQILIEREKANDYDANNLIPTIIGNITSYCAYKGILNIEDMIDNLKIFGKKYFVKKATTFEKEVEEKINNFRDI